jgi:hypothetical protein
MEQITIRVKDKNKARWLREFLKSLDFVDLVVSEDIENEIQRMDEDNFFALAGIWQGRDISLDSIRQKAWPRLK